MKKNIAIMLSICMVLGVSACNNTTANEPEPAKQEEIKNENIEDEIQETKFDITGDNFITLLNAGLKDTDLVLENIEENETEDENSIYYIAKNNNIAIQYQVDKQTNDLLMVDLSITDIMNKDKISDFKEYFMRIRLIIDIDANAETLFDELNINDFETSGWLNYESNNVRYDKVVSEDLTYIHITPVNKKD